MCRYIYLLFNLLVILSLVLAFTQQRDEDTNTDTARREVSNS